MVQFRERMLTWYYCNSLMYASLYLEKPLDRRYEERVRSVSVRDFRTYAVHIRNDVIDNDGKSH